MKTIEGFRLRKLGDEYILMGETLALINFNKMVTLNETAAFLWKEAEKESVEQGGFTIEALCAALCEAYEVTSEMAQNDVTATVASWQEAGVIES